MESFKTPKPDGQINMLGSFKKIKDREVTQTSFVHRYRPILTAVVGSAEWFWESQMLSSLLYALRLAPEGRAISDFRFQKGDITVSLLVGLPLHP